LGHGPSGTPRSGHQREVRPERNGTRTRTRRTRGNRSKTTASWHTCAHPLGAAVSAILVVEIREWEKDYEIVPWIIESNIQLHRFDIVRSEQQRRRATEPVISHMSPDTVRSQHYVDHGMFLRRLIHT
jgi:hypothetical protein